jgi:hypothetical protein
MNEIEHRDRARQIMSFENMRRRWGLRPTDIDGFQEYCGKLFIYLEGKLINKSMDIGQKRAFEHICESYYEHDTEPKSLSKHFAWVLIFEHNTRPEEDVIIADQYVTEVYSSVFPEWRAPNGRNVVPKFNLDSNGTITVIEAIAQIENWCYENNIPIGKED